jgi:phosphoglycolate phosphatase
MKQRIPRFQGIVEFAASFRPRPEIKHVLFDFDGTLSLIRQGWPEVMVPMFIETLPRRDGESDADLTRMATDDIMRLNGKQTIFQMIQLAERIRERGGTPLEPLWYKREYLRRLDLRIQDRLDRLRQGTVATDEFVVHAARLLLERLSEMGLTLHLASGTDEPLVQQEAELLGLSGYFGGRVFGALDNYQEYSKQMVIERILQDNSISGEQLLSFGDGYVEIENTKQAGGLAVAVASDEANNGLGQIDDWKRQRLLGVGADVVIPDYRDAVPLMETITTP